MSEADRDANEELVWLIADTGEVQAWKGGYRIRVFHTRSFPWDDVFKALLYRNYKVSVARHKADLYVEASP